MIERQLSRAERVENFIRNQDEMEKQKKDEFRVDGTVLTFAGLYAPAAYKILVLGASSSAMVWPIVAAYAAGRFSENLTQCFFKKNTNPSDADLEQFESQAPRFK